MRLWLRVCLGHLDNFAVGYFRKQGFTQKISMPKERWFGFIKDYEGGTLMECRISPKVDYLRLFAILNDQQEAVQRAILRLKPPRVSPGLTCWQVSVGETTLMRCSLDLEECVKCCVV